MSLRDATKRWANVKGKVDSNQVHKQTNLEMAKKKKKCLATIDCLDYSSKLDIIAFGGVSGEICVIESTTFSFKGLYTAHTSEVTSLYFDDTELQMISMSHHGDITLWDA
jgi:hypothetical protein